LGPEPYRVYYKLSDQEFCAPWAFAIEGIDAIFTATGLRGYASCIAFLTELNISKNLQQLDFAASHGRLFLGN